MSRWFPRELGITEIGTNCFRVGDYSMMADDEQKLDEQQQPAGESEVSVESATATLEASLPQSGEPLRILLCGSRDWTDRESIKKELVALLEKLQVAPSSAMLIHGDCRGADTLGDSVAEELGIMRCRCPVTQADWNKHGKSAGPKRNQKMLDDYKPNVVIAFHPNENVQGVFGSGTGDMVRRSLAFGVPVRMVCS
jgi:hypothetical protein